jgi:hypothetical protein
MYSYQRNAAKRQYESLVPKRNATMQLLDNREKSIVQRKFLKNSQTQHDVIQLGKSKTYENLEFKRPAFTTDSKISATRYTNLITKPGFSIRIKKPGLPDLNLAQPHRISWKDIYTLTRKDRLSPKGFPGFKRMNKAFLKAGEIRIKKITNLVENENKNSNNSYLDNRNKKNRTPLEDLLWRAERSQTTFAKALVAFKKAKNTKNFHTYLKEANSFHANVPDYGPHLGVNNPVSASFHANFEESSRQERLKEDNRARSPSPMTRHLLKGLKGSDLTSGIAVSTDGNYITTSGAEVDESFLAPDVQKNLQKFQKKVIPKFDKNTVFGPDYIPIAAAKKKAREEAKKKAKKNKIKKALDKLVKAKKKSKKKSKKKKY